MEKNQTRVLSGKNAKLFGHKKEKEICQWLNETLTDTFIVDAKPKTKQDIINLTNNTAYSIKSTKGTHTQCHLTSSERWCDYFKIDGKLKKWFYCFFGIPGIDISDGSDRQHRLNKSQIDNSLNNLALTWFNQNKISIFDVIVAEGMYNTPVQTLIWHQKKTDKKYIISIEDLRSMVYNGSWVLNSTTLHFYTEDDKKMFHLQMKGSGEKYTSSYHSLMFHIYKCF